MLTRTYSTSTNDRPEEESGFDLREMIGFVWRQWKFITSIVVATLLIAAVYVWTATPRYTASALVLLEPQRDRIPGTDASANVDVNLDYAIVESQIAIIKSTVFLRRVVERTNLVSDPEFGSHSPKIASPQTTTGAIAPSASAEAKTEQPTPEDGDIPSDVMASIQRLKGAITVGRAGQGYILAISVTSVDPERAARLANAVADAYVVEKLDARFEAAKRGSSWLSDRLVDLRKQLHDFRGGGGRFPQGTRICPKQYQRHLKSAAAVRTQRKTPGREGRRQPTKRPASIFSIPSRRRAAMFRACRT